MFDDTVDTFSWHVRDRSMDMLQQHSPHGKTKKLIVAECKLCMWLCLCGFWLTADWSPTREPCTDDFHRVERCLVRVRRDWHEASVFLVLVQRPTVFPAKPRLERQPTVVVVTEMSIRTVCGLLESYVPVRLLSDITILTSSHISIVLHCKRVIMYKYSV